MVLWSLLLRLPKPVAFDMKIVAWSNLRGQIQHVVYWRVSMLDNVLLDTDML